MLIDFLVFILTLALLGSIGVTCANLFNYFNAAICSVGAQRIEVQRYCAERIELGMLSIIAFSLQLCAVIYRVSGG